MAEIPQKILVTTKIIEFANILPKYFLMRTFHGNDFHLFAHLK